MRDLVANLSPRERLMVGGLGVVLLLTFLVFGVIGPLMGFEGRAKQDYARAERLSVLSQSAEPRQTRSSDARPLRTVVTDTANRNNLVITRINMADDGVVEVALSNAPHASFFTWLDRLAGESGVVVAEAFVTPGETPGRVEARLTLVREG